MSKLSLQAWVLGFFCCLSINLSAQTLTLSPYSRYGIGDIFNNTNSRSAGMGGISIGTSAVYVPNRQNPASYADFLAYNPRKRYDLRRTTLDVSGFTSLSSQSTKNQTAQQSSVGFKDLIFLFPSNKNMAFAAGFMPYSTVGYAISDSFRVPIDTVSTLSQIDYLGRGGLNQAFIGGATTLMKSRLRLGANLYYAFGTIENEWVSYVDSSIYNNVKIKKSTYMGGLGAQLGMQYQDTLKRDTADAPILFRVGLVTDVNGRLNARRVTSYQTIGVGNVSDTLLVNGNEETSQKIKVPTRIGGGFEISKPMVWYVGADVVYQNWTGFQYFNDKQELKSELHVGLGGEWTPNFIGDKYYQRINYRAGAFFHTTYLNYNGKAVDEKGITLGFGLPLAKSKQVISEFLGKVNVGVELGTKGNLTYHPLRENYVRFRFGITVSERWFIRRVVD